MEMKDAAPFWAVHTKADPSSPPEDSLVFAPTVVARESNARRITNREAARQLAAENADPVADPEGLVAARWPLDVARKLEEAAVSAGLPGPGADGTSGMDPG